MFTCMVISRYGKGDWLKYRNGQSYVVSGKVLDVRPDNFLVIGTHELDPEPDIVDPDDICGRVKDK